MPFPVGTHLANMEGGATTAAWVVTSARDTNDPAEQSVLSRDYKKKLE